MPHFRAQDLKPIAKGPTPEERRPRCFRKRRRRTQRDALDAALVAGRAGAAAPHSQNQERSAAPEPT